MITFFSAPSGESNNLQSIRRNLSCVTFSNWYESNESAARSVSTMVSRNIILRLGITSPMMYGTEKPAILQLEEVTYISQAGPSLDERGRRARAPLAFPPGSLEMMNGIGHKKPISGSAASLGQVITGSGCNSLERFEKECAGKRCDLSTFHYSRGVRTSHRSLPPASSFPRCLALCVFTLPPPFPPSTFPFAIRDQRERSHLATSSGYKKTK